MVCVIAIISSLGSAEGHNMMEIDTQAVFRETSPMLWGIFFEEINHSGDGGLYAEMVRNRSFEDNRVPEGCTEEGDHFVSPSGWKLPKKEQAIPNLAWDLVVDKSEARFALKNENPLNDASPTYGELTIVSVSPGGRAGIANEGFWGMAIRPDEQYLLSVFVRAPQGYYGRLLASLESADGEHVYATAELPQPTATFTRITATLRSTGADNRARLLLSGDTPGTLHFDVVSLFPKATFKNRPNGLRRDIAEMLSGLRPSFIRFPGGCIVEGFTFQSAWNWKETVGDIAERPGRQNLWGYRASDGLGYHELLQLAEDLGAEPIVVLNCGMTCQARQPMFKPLEEMDSYIQDVLDAIEYANGGPETPWGAKRVENGHPQPFHLKYVTIGNENHGPEYEKRYRLIADAVRAKYPDVHIIANSTVSDAPVDFEEHHYYSIPEWFVAHAHLYDTYDRTKPKVFVSEFAANAAAGKGNLIAAVAESAFMIGLENNSDIVSMAAYAPLLNNEHDREWPVNLIVFDNHRVYGTPSYHIQKLFSENRPDVLFKVRFPEHIQRRGFDTGRVGVGTWATRAEFKDIEVKEGDRLLYRWDPNKGTEGWFEFAGEWVVEDGSLRQNDLGNQRRIYVGDPTWKNYTFHLKARKAEGQEGFLITVRSHNEWNWVTLNLGGWGNNKHGVTSSYNNIVFNTFAERPGTIESGKWYDIVVTVENDRITAWLDGEQIVDTTIPAVQIPGIFANAGRITETNEYVIKVTNYLDTTIEMPVVLKGREGTLTGTRTIMTNPDLAAENSLDNPQAVVPVSESFRAEKQPFSLALPPYSFTLLRLRAD